MSLKIILLTFMTIFHGIFQIAGISFITTFSLGFHFWFLDILVCMILFSFLVFRRCVWIDIYSFVKGNIKKLPYYAKDNFTRNMYLKLLNIKPPKDYTKYRLDIIENIEPFIGKSKKVIKKFFNRKVEYLLANTILLVILLIKYNLHYLIPPLVIGMFIYLN